MTCSREIALDSTLNQFFIIVDHQTRVECATEVLAEKEVTTESLFEVIASLHVEIASLHEGMAKLGQQLQEQGQQMQEQRQQQMQEQGQQQMQEQGQQQTVAIARLAQQVEKLTSTLSR